MVRYSSQTLEPAHQPAYSSGPVHRDSQWERDSVTSTSRDNSSHHIASNVMADQKGFTRRPMTRVMILPYSFGQVLLPDPGAVPQTLLQLLIITLFAEFQPSIGGVVPGEGVGLHQPGGGGDGRPLPHGRACQPSLRVPELPQPR